ncbi:MAG TPA: transcriptional repressor LexA [Candidatus Bathyarchaeia archaeon]|nr:transcriptional repressor LexA [Candidatus Bathyarchaeia archaeon]
MPVIIYERQRQILDFLAQYIQRNGTAPSLREIADAMHLNSLATVHEHMDQLRRKGVIRVIGKGKTRKVEIVDKKFSDIDSGVKIPIVGYFSAGEAIQPYAETNVFFGVAPSMASSKKRTFILEVKGDQLEQEAILDGDLLVLEEESNVKDKDIIIAILENKVAVLKRFFQETTRVRLEPIKSNESHLYTDKVTIQGRLMSIVRTYWSK